MRRLFSLAVALTLASAQGWAAESLPIPPVKPAVPATETAALPVVPPGPAAPGAVAVQLEAIIAAGGKPMAEPIAWTVASAEKLAGQAEEVVASQVAARPKLSLLPGRYKVTAEYGLTKVTRDLVVGTAAGKQTVVLDAGYLTLRLIPHSGAKPIADDVDWELYVYAGGAAENGKKLLSASAPTQSYLLPAGAYVVRAHYEGATADLVVPLGAGQGYNYTINLYAGILDARAVKPSGGSLVSHVTWEIMKATPSEDGKRETVAWFIGDKGKVTLREGSYIAVARSSNMSNMEEFEIKAGRTKKLKLVLKTGINKVPAGAVAPPPPPAG